MNGLKGWLDSNRIRAGVAGVAAIVLVLVACIGAVRLGAIPSSDGKDGGDAPVVEAQADVNASDDAKAEASDAGEASDADADSESEIPQVSETDEGADTSPEAESSVQPSGANGDGAASASSPNTSSFNQSSSASSNTGSTASQSSQSAHTHSWKEHTAQKWVSNMVTVPDYETQKIAVGTKFIFAYDGFSTTDVSVAEQHAVELILAGVPDNYRMETIYETQTVQVGSHQEDQGHYEIYVDYYYCDCGATK